MWPVRSKNLYGTATARKPRRTRPWIWRTTAELGFYLSQLPRRSCTISTGKAGPTRSRIPVGFVRPWTLCIARPQEAMISRWVYLEENKKAIIITLYIIYFRTGIIKVVKIAEKAVCRRVFLTTWHCVLSAELTKTHSSRLFFGDFAHWGKTNECKLAGFLWY